MMYKESTPADYDEKVMLHAIRNHTRQTAYLADLRSAVNSKETASNPFEEQVGLG